MLSNVPKAVSTSAVPNIMLRKTNRMIIRRISCAVIVPACMP